MRYDGGLTLRLFSKWTLVTIYWIAQAVIIYFGWIAWLAISPDIDPEPGYWRDLEYALPMASIVGAMMLLQLLFLVPVRRPVAAATRGISVWTSLGVAGLMGGLLAGCVVLVIYDIVWLILDEDRLDEKFWAYLPPGVALLSWIVATPLLIAFCKTRPRERLLGRVAARLFAGTLIEVAAIIPIDVMVRRKTECYCGQGTFWALSICGGVGMFALGPAIFLPLISRRRKRWYANRCEICGYDMTGLADADRCPECGAGWRSNRQSKD